MSDKEVTTKEYFYPDNLSGQILIFMWSFLDYGIMLGLLAASLMLSLFAKFHLFYASIVIYGFMSAKIAKTYSIIKISKFYIRFLITDQLKFKWRR